MANTENECLFCRIVAGTVPATVVHRDERTVAFRDIDPKAPTHILLIPTTHYDNVAQIADSDPATLAALVGTARDVALAEGLAESGYRLVFNTGAGAGQSVFHAHLHLLGGRRMTWPPG